MKTDSISNKFLINRKKNYQETYHEIIGTHSCRKCTES